MERDLSRYRKVYQKHQLIEADCPKNPFLLFDAWFEGACQNESGEANTMQIVTMGTDGFPRARIVLLKFFSEKGFIFYTNYNSEKGKSIAQNNKVGLSFFWQDSQRQVHIKGTAQKLNPVQSDAYFASRPRGSQLGAVVSAQSTVIKNRDILQTAYEATEKKYNAQKIPRPNHWGGYLVTPKSIEFWQGRSDRMHDRIAYRLKNNQWNFYRLSP